jgi:hypothetical protein
VPPSATTSQNLREHSIGKRRLNRDGRFTWPERFIEPLDRLHDRVVPGAVE